MTTVNGAFRFLKTQTKLLENCDQSEWPDYYRRKYSQH